MLVPRLIISLSDLSGLRMNAGDSVLSGLGILLQLRGKGRSERLLQAQEAKSLCLHYGMTLLLDNLEIGALVNADGIYWAIDDHASGRAKDVLGQDKLIGGTAHSIQDVANLFEEGMVDFVILKSLLDDGAYENILGKQKAQSIIDDARIMGYDIPIILAGGIQATNAQEALDMRCYGVVLDNPTGISTVLQYISYRSAR